MRNTRWGEYYNGYSAENEEVFYLWRPKGVGERGEYLEPLEGREEEEEEKEEEEEDHATICVMYCRGTRMVIRLNPLTLFKGP